jgi:DNA polymerase-3 subunit beta
MITTTKSEIGSAVKSAAGVAPSKSTMPIVTNLLIRKQGDSVTFTASDLELEMHYKASIAGDDFAVTVPAKKFGQIIGAMKADDKITMSLDGNKLLVKAGRSRFNLATLPADDYPEMPAYTASDAAKFTITQQALQKAIGSVIHAVAVQDIRTYLNGVYLESKGTLIAVGTDGHRLSAYKTDAPCPAFSTIVPRKAAEELLRQLKPVDTPVSVEINDRYALFDLGYLTIKTKLIENKFPDYERVVPSSNDNYVSAGKAELVDSIGRASILANDKLNGVLVSVSGGIMAMACKNIDGEESNDEIEVQHDGEDIETGFNFHYLRDAVAAIDSDSINMAFRTGAAGAVLITGNDAALRCVVMPMRM